ncbi:MAG: TIR domain-containing protein [Saprospiraceae bacterium]
MDKKAQIQELISLGKTEEALELLEQLTTDAVLLQSRYNGAKRQYSMGMIDFSEWSRTQAQINYAALEMMNSVKLAKAEVKPEKEKVVDQKESEKKQPAQAKSEKRVFISYSHQDGFAMRAVKDFLAKKKTKVYIDINDLSAGDSIQGFIDEALRNNDFVISIISANSLRSGWVSKELVVAKYLSKTNSNWIPVSIDDAWANNKFFFDANTEIDKKINEVRLQIKNALESDLDISPFTDELKRLQDLKANLGSTISDLKNVLVVDISGNLFEVGMKKVVEKIRAN